MDITWKMDEGLPIEGSDERTDRRLSEITIKLTRDDDPHGYLVGLAWNQRLEAFLQVFGRPVDYGMAGYSVTDLLDLLNRTGYVGYHLRNRLDGLMLAARDQFGIGWGTIATTVERPRQTVRDQIRVTRRQAADQGFWYDGDGLHEGTGDEARAAIDGRD